MGIWGPGLYDNDCTSDIRDAFSELVHKGVHPQVAAQQIREENETVFCDEEDGPLAELALREQLFRHGAIKKKELAQVLSYLESGGDLEYWKESNPTLFAERKKELLRLEVLFRSSPPKILKASKGGWKSKINWNVGQVFAVPIAGDTQVLKRFQGEYILLYVYGEANKVDRYPIPKVYVKLTKGGQLPKNAEDFNALEYVQISCTAMKDRFRPFASFEDLPEEYRQRYCPDAWGFLPEYTMVLMKLQAIILPIR